MVTDHLRCQLEYCVGPHYCAKTTEFILKCPPYFPVHAKHGKSEWKKTAFQRNLSNFFSRNSEESSKDALKFSESTGVRAILGIFISFLAGTCEWGVSYLTEQICSAAGKQIKNCQNIAVVFPNTDLDIWCPARNTSPPSVPASMPYLRWEIKIALLRPKWYILFLLFMLLWHACTDRGSLKNHPRRQVCISNYTSMNSLLSDKAFSKMSEFSLTESKIPNQVRFPVTFFWPQDRCRHYNRLAATRYPPFTSLTHMMSSLHATPHGCCWQTTIQGKCGTL